MNVAQMIDWLKSMPYNAEVQVVRHCSRGSYYEQGGTASIMNFSDFENYRSTYETYIDGTAFELYTDSEGKQTLTLGKLND